MQNKMSIISNQTILSFFIFFFFLETEMTDQQEPVDWDAAIEDQNTCQGTCRFIYVNLSELFFNFLYLFKLRVLIDFNAKGCVFSIIN